MTVCRLVNNMKKKNTTGERQGTLKEFQQAVRMGRWKAIRLKPGGALEVYDLDADPREARNIAAERPDVVAAIDTYLRTARTESERWPAR